MSIQELLTDLKTAYANASLNCGEGLLPPASDEAIDHIAEHLGLPVPEELRDVLRVYGGQEYITPGVTGFLGKHRLHTPLEIVERHQMYLDDHVRFPFDPPREFPPKPDDWGYWNPALIPFASWDCYELCVHSDRGDVWEFDPNFGLTAHRPSLAAVLRDLIDAVKSGKEPALLIDPGKPGVRR